jgi:hypothetical protein
MIRTLLMASLLLALAACQNSKEFTWPSPDKLVLGETTQQEVIAIYGQPYGQEQARIVAGGGDVNAPANNLNVVRLFYRYRDPLEMAVSGGDWGKERRISFDFANERLFSYIYQSTFRGDHTNFDEKKAADLESGKTTRADIARMFGKPSGRATFPASPVGTETDIYAYQQTGQRWQIVKRLEAVIDENEVLKEFKLTNETLPVYRPAPNVFMPVYVPKK